MEMMNSWLVQVLCLCTISFAIAGGSTATGKIEVKKASKKSVVKLHNILSKKFSLPDVNSLPIKASMIHNQPGKARDLLSDVIHSDYNSYAPSDKQYKVEPEDTEKGKSRQLYDFYKHKSDLSEMDNQPIDHQHAEDINEPHFQAHMNFHHADVGGQPEPHTSELYAGEMIGDENSLSKYITPPVYEEGNGKRKTLQSNKHPSQSLHMSEDDKETEQLNTKSLMDHLDTMMTPIEHHNGDRVEEQSSQESARGRSDDERPYGDDRSESRDSADPSQADQRSYSSSNREQQNNDGMHNEENSDSGYNGYSQNRGAIGDNEENSEGASDPGRYDGKRLQELNNGNGNESPASEGSQQGSREGEEQGGNENSEGALQRQSEQDKGNTDQSYKDNSEDNESKLYFGMNHKDDDAVPNNLDLGMENHNDRPFSRIQGHEQEELGNMMRDAPKGEAMNGQEDSSYMQANNAKPNPIEVLQDESGALRPINPSDSRNMDQGAKLHSESK